MSEMTTNEMAQRMIKELGVTRRPEGEGWRSASEIATVTKESPNTVRNRLDTLANHGKLTMQKFTSPITGRPVKYYKFDK